MLVLHLPLDLPLVLRLPLGVEEVFLLRLVLRLRLLEEACRRPVL
jgi:hypothetical protein